MANIEQQWANVDLANSLETSPVNTAQNEETSLVTDKLLKLEEAKKSKLETLSTSSTTKINNNQFKNYEDVTITGMEDADTFMLSDGRKVRVSDPLLRYDAAEVAHPESTWDSVKGMLGFGDNKKSSYAEQAQNEHVGRILGKGPNAVSKEDVFSVGNMQQIQVLSDLMRNAGEDRWEAQVEPGAAQVDLNSGLNIGAKIKISGTDVYGRVLADVVNPRTGENVTRLHAQDQKLNAFAPGYKTAGYTIDEKGNVVDTVDRDGMLGESVDTIQAAAIKQYAGTVDALNQGVRWLAKKAGAASETVDKYVPEDVKIGLVGEGKYTARQLVDDGVADKLTGVMASTREDQQTAMKTATNNVIDGDYVGAAGEIISVLPYMLGDSAGEIGAIMLGTPGIISAVGNRVNNDVVEYKKNNDGQTPDEQWLLGSTLLNSAALLGEKWLVKSGAGAVIEKGLSKAGRAGAVAQSTVGESLQEWYDNTQQTYMTQKEGQRTVGEIATSPDAVVAGLAGGLMGGALSGTGQTVGAIKDRVFDSEVVDKLNSKISETKTEGPTKFGSTLDAFEASVADGKAGLNTREFKKFFQENTNELTAEEAKRVQSIFKTYQENVSSIRTNLVSEDGKVNKDVLRAEPVAVEELLKLIMNKDLSDEDAEGFIGQLTKEDFAEYADIDVSRMQDKIRRIRNKSKEASSELAAFEAVNKDIFENGYLQYDSIVEALNSGNIMQKENFLGYEKEKLSKLENAIEATKNKLENIHSGDTETIKALAYLEGVNTAKDSAVNPVFEKEMIVAAAKLMGIATEGKTYVNIGKEAREKYKGSNWQKEVAKANTTIDGFTNAFQSATEGRFEVRAWEALGELVESNFANTGKMRTPGYRKVTKAIDSEVELISRFIDLDKESEFTKDELVNMLKAERAPKVDEEVNVADYTTVEEPTDNVSSLRNSALRQAKRQMQREIRDANVAEDIEEATEPEPYTGNVETPVDTKVEDIKVDEKPFEGTPKQARESEVKIGKELVNEAKALTDDRKWLDNSYKVLKELFTEANKIKNIYQPLLNTKFEEKKLVQEELNKVIRDIAEIKKDIDKAKAVKGVLNEKTKGKVGEALKAVLGVLRKLLEAIGVLDSKLVQAKLAKTDLYKRLDELNAEIDQLLKVKESKARDLEEVNTNIRNQQESISVQKEGIATRAAKIKDLVKEKKKSKDAFKPSTKSVANGMMNVETAFSGWNKPIEATTSEGTLKTKYALTDVLEVSNAVAPLAVVRYNQLTEDNYTYPQIVSDVTNLVKQLVVDEKGFSKGQLKSVPGGSYKYGNDDSKTFTTETMAYNAPALSFIVEKNSSLEVRENVAIAMEVAMNEWLMNDAISSDEITAKDVAKYYGMDEQDVSSNLLEQIRKLGIPVRFMAENIGDKVLKHAGFKVTGNDVDEKIELSTRLKESLGMYVMHLAERKGQVTIQNKAFNEVAEMMGKEKDETAEDITVTTLVFNSTAKKSGKDNWAKRKEDLGVVEQYKGVNFVRPSVKSVKANIKRNKVTNAPKKLLEAKKDAMLREWHLKGIEGESAVSELFEMDRNIVAKAMGFVQAEDIEKLPFMMRGPTASKNRQIMTSVDSLFGLADTLKNGQELNSFWFDYFIGKNNRTYLDSDGVNNQSDKFHRHLIYTDGQRATVVPGERSEKVWKLGVAQAFGYDVDKMKVEESIKFAEKILANASEVEAGWKLVKDTGAKSFMVAGKEIKVKEMGHLVDGIQAVRDYAEADGKEFETSLLIEADAVTSGFALKMLQLIGDLDQPLGYGSEITGREWLRKVGIFVDEEGNLLGNSDIVDGYKTLGKNMTSENIEASVQTALEDEEKSSEIMSNLNADTTEEAVSKASEVTKMFTDIIGELVAANGDVSKTARNLFKPPFMTFMYGAGFTKINKELAAMVIDLVFEKLVSYDNLSVSEKKALDKLMMEVTGKELKGAARHIFITKDLKEEKAEGSLRSMYDVMEGYVASSFGVTVESTMRKEFGDIIQVNEAILEINNAVFNVFDQKFKEKLSEAELTLDNVDKITSTLVDSFPIVKGPLSEGINDGIALFKTEIAKGLKDIFSPKYSNAGGYFADKEGKLTSRGVNHVIRLYKEAASAAGVIPIHTLDGAAMAMTVIGKDVQQVFDAIVGGVDNIEGIVTDYNRNAYEMSMKWDFLYEVLEMGERVLGDPANKVYIDNYINKRNEKKPFNLDKYIIPLIDFANANAKFKEDFKSKKGIIEHMVFSEETAYTTDGKELTPEEILSKMSPAVMAKVDAELDKPLKEMFKDCSKG